MRTCPDCDLSTEAEICPKCGLRTLAARRQDAGPDPNLGRVLENRYRVDALIGRGGMGAVYRGTQLSTGQTVAIKLIRSDMARSDEAAKRFNREARAAGRLRDPHTVKVMDFGEQDGDLYLVLEFLDGQTLGRLLARSGRIPERRAAKIAGEVCRSLAEAHEAGLAHRDLKPDNVMLVKAVGDEDFVKVLDFGIAKVLSGSSGESGLTRSGAVVGTPQYMAPEQSQATHAITPAVDVYALGVVLHQALTGRRPFDGDSAIQILMAHVREPVPELPPDAPVSAEMRTLVMRMLAKAPAERPTAAALVTAFERLRVAPDRREPDGSAVHAPAVPAPRIPAGLPTAPVTLPSGPVAGTLVDESDLPPTEAIRLEATPPAATPMAAAAPPPRPRSRAPLWWVVVAGLAGVGAAALYLAAFRDAGVSAPAAADPGPAPAPAPAPTAPAPALAPVVTPPAVVAQPSAAATTSVQPALPKTRKPPRKSAGMDDLPALRVDPAGGAAR